MKNTLILTMMAAALLGGQVFAETAVYKVSDYKDGRDCDMDNSEEATLVVDAHRTFDCVIAGSPNCLTLDYQGEFVLTASNVIDTPDYGVLNITSSIPSVASAWEETFSDAEGGSITLCSAGYEVNSIHGPVQFFGKEANNTVKLGDTEVMFKGVVADLAALDMNQVGVVWGEQDVKLVGKVVKSVPEPTTGTLSLLALAGLCARRRRK